MAVSYITFLKISASHNYFQSGVPLGITYFPSESTVRKLKNNRLKFNQYQGGFDLSFQSADGISPLIPANELKLTFLVKLESTLEFFNFTNFSNLGDFNARKKLFFQNNPQNAAQINPGLIDSIRPNQFTYAIPIVTADPENETIGLELEHLQSGTKYLIEKLPAKADGSYESPINLAGKPEGLYSFTATASISNETSSDKILIDKAIYRDQIFGIIEILYTGDTLDAYELMFERKSNFWNYVLVNRTNRSDFNNLEIKDNNMANVGPYQTYLFEKKQTGFTIGNIPAIRFQSKTEIPFFELPKRNIELVKNVNGNDLVLMKNLANPPVNQVSGNENESDIYVFV